MSSRTYAPVTLLRSVGLVHWTLKELVRLQPTGAKRILLVTDPQHLVRATRLFVGTGFEVLPAPADEYLRTAESPEGRIALTRVILLEMIARAYYRLAGYL